MVSGRITIDGTAEGLGDVVVNCGDFGFVLSYDDGKWFETGLEGEVEIIPQKDGWLFTPASVCISGFSADVDFKAARPPEYTLFEDPLLEEAVRARLGKMTGHLAPSDLRTLGHLDARGS